MTENLKDIIKKEYLKCALDCEYFLKKYSYINSFQKLFHEGFINKFNKNE